MSDIERRSLITAAGAGLLLAGCGKSGDASENHASSPMSKTTSLIDSRYGGSFPHGELATAARPSKLGNVQEFNPEYLCVLYFRFEPTRLLSVRLAYVNLTVSKPTLQQVEELASPIIQKMHSNQQSSIVAVRKEEDLELFGFSSQQIVVIFVDNDPGLVKFEDANDEFVVRFVPFSGRQPGELVQENHAFFNLQPFDLVTPMPSGAQRAYKLDYWNTDGNGNKITSLYPLSMNIHLKMAVRRSGGQTTHWAPVIVDPDTGNMGSRP